MSELHVTDISFTHTNQKTPLLNQITFSVRPGVCTAIMGLNGVGKTTLLKVMTGFLPSQSGTVTHHNQNVLALSAKERARLMAFVPQSFPTDFPFRVREFVLMGRFAWLDGMFHEARDHDLVSEALALMQMSDFDDRLVSTLSGGEKQRVLLARALVQESPIILLDEPNNHLDLKHKIDVLELLQELAHKKQKTIIAVMHDPRDVVAYFDDVLFLKAGANVVADKAQNANDSKHLKEIFGV